MQKFLLKLFLEKLSNMKNIKFQKIIASKYNYTYIPEGRGLNLTKKYNLNVASDIAGRVLCLPLYPDLEMETVDKIINIIKRLV